MADLLFCLLLLQGQAGLPAAVAPPPLRAIALDAVALEADPSPLAADTLALVVEYAGGAFFKLSEGDAVLAAGRFLPGANALRFTRPGLTATSRSLLFVLDLLEGDVPTHKLLRLQVTVAERPDSGPASGKGPARTFRLEMYHQGRLFGYREKSMVELLQLTTGQVLPVPDPGLSGAVGRTPGAGQSASLLGLGTAVARLLAGKKPAAGRPPAVPETIKKSLSLTLTRPDAQGLVRAVSVSIVLSVD
jgi:hypothetical protein